MLMYEPLRDYLAQVESSRKTMSFKQIEVLLGHPLPKSAYTYQAWWANEADPAHPQKQAWGAAGFQTEVDLKSKTVKFLR